MIFPSTTPPKVVADRCSGIRHALKEDTMTPTYADARFMLVCCSAFTNYLWTVAAELDISIG